ncbi:MULTISPECIES: DUF3888 domain-containing protein [Bacillus]|uniref:DUF3888 domain-containing protein n=2 Tax=Bacillus TaxID=1386 RepID=A0A0M3R8Y1_9BACI|nr:MULTISPECIES: DUF3888 domain-containing protein [Bacillus]ALC80472.1 hypothetical protein AM592_01890 [Bacillus gobiensis]MBP1083535.1 hypothetical protein [Bacillus capparidis]MED1094732.1 DUF3888 domain-containing protein [Bacillus capparidis]
MIKRFVIVLVVTFTASMCFNCEAETVYTPPMNSREELYQDIFVSLLSVEIDKAVNEYYKKVLNYSPMVYPYQVYIEKAERIGEYRRFEFTVIIKVTPVVGPHIQVGLDRLTLYINGSGRVNLKKYEHLRDYELPEHWQHILIH